MLIFQGCFGVNDFLAALSRSRIVALLGPRQAGKTTLARELAGKRQATIFDLEDPVDFACLGLAKQVIPWDMASDQLTHSNPNF